MNQRETKVQITVLTVPGCPNAPLARRRIAAALNGRVVSVEVADEVVAAQRRMTGSPTILVNGADPFATPGSRPSVSCRLYRHADGTVDGAPTEEGLRRAFAADPPAPDSVH